MNAFDKAHFSSLVDFKMNTLNNLISEHINMLLCLNNFKYSKQIFSKSGEEKWQRENKKCSSVLKKSITYTSTNRTYSR